MSANEELFLLMVLWNGINFAIIVFLFNRLSQIYAIKKELKDLQETNIKTFTAITSNTKQLALVGPIIEDYLCDKTTHSIMIKLKEENFPFPFDDYKFNSNNFWRLSKLVQDMDKTFIENYTNKPSQELTIKELVLPYFRENWPEEKFIEEFEKFIKRHNMEEKKQN